MPSFHSYGLTRELASPEDKWRTSPYICPAIRTVRQLCEKFQFFYYFINNTNNATFHKATLRIGLKVNAGHGVYKKISFMQEAR
jgi:hypothetical protein